MHILPNVLENINLVLSLRRIFMAKKSWGDLALYRPTYLYVDNLQSEMGQK